MLRNLLGVIAGVIAGSIVFLSIQWVNSLIVGSPQGFDSYDSGAKKAFLDNMPLYGWLVILLSYALGSFVAGLVGGKLAESDTKIFPVVIALIFMLGWLSNIMVLPHPLWIVITVFLIYLPATLAGHRFAVSFRE